METHFKVAKWEQTETGFNHLGYDEYLITYLKGKKPHQIKIVVDGILTKRIINLIDGKSGYKNQILFAISDVKNAKIDLTQRPSEKKKVTLGYISTFYSKLVVRNVKNYLMGINKEESRDKLTKFELVQMKNRFDVQLLPPKEFTLEDIFNDEKKEGIKKLIKEHKDGKSK